MTAQGAGDRRIVDIVLDESAAACGSPEIEHERRVAVLDFLENNRFDPVGAPSGPYALRLAAAGNRLEMRIAAADGAEVARAALSVPGLRRVVHDYFTVCKNCFEAIRAAPPSRIEALDMGRRAIHDEGARLLRERLASRVAIDHDTARRLFTLVCVLHRRG